MIMIAIKPTPPTPRHRDTQPSTGVGRIAAVSPSGRLRLLAAGNTAATALNRRTRTGTTYRIDLGAGISCWLDGDQADGGELNWVATSMCATLSEGRFVGPDDAPFMCGLVLFTGTATAGPAALPEQQLRQVVSVHCAATADELRSRELASHADVQHSLT